ncbi:MAG: RING finger protein [Candidatus Hermodarchaeota archaeon]
MKRVIKSTLLGVGLILTAPLLVLLFLFGEEIFESLNIFFSSGTLFIVIIIIIIVSVFFFPFFVTTLNDIKDIEEYSMQENPFKQLIKKHLYKSQLLEASYSKPIFPKVNCIICQLSMKEGEEMSECPYCGVKGHTGHFKEWLRTKSICPNCRTELREVQLANVTEEHEKLVVPKRECWVCQNLLEFTQPICPKCNSSQICRLCKDYIEYLDNRVVCPECKTPLHKQCIQFLEHKWCPNPHCSYIFEE